MNCNSYWSDLILIASLKVILENIFCSSVFSAKCELPTLILHFSFDRRWCFNEPCNDPMSALSKTTLICSRSTFTVAFKDAIFSAPVTAAVQTNHIYSWYFSSFSILPTCIRGTKRPLYRVPIPRLLRLPKVIYSESYFYDLFLFFASLQLSFLWKQRAIFYSIELITRLQTTCFFMVVVIKTYQVYAHFLNMESNCRVHSLCFMTRTNQKSKYFILFNKYIFCGSRSSVAGLWKTILLYSWEHLTK